MLSLEKKERIRANLRSFVTSLPDNIANRELLVSAVEEIMEEVSVVDTEKANASDIKLLILEMREGFRRMDERFVAIDERFVAIDKRFESVDKRFETIDKKFDDLIHFMDKRFEDQKHSQDKRFESADKRFEAIDKRIGLLQWTIGFSMALLAFLITLFGYLKPPISEEALEKAIISGMEKSMRQSKP